MDREQTSDAALSGNDPDLSAFYSLAKKGIPPHERSLLYNEVRTIRQRYCDHVEIARGGIKRISRVYDRKTGQHVAFACLREPERNELYDPFLREARLTGALHHPNIISIYDLGLDENGEPFFVMELKPGKTLDRIIKERCGADSPGRSLDELLSIFLKICDAMAYAHSRNILHLDLKPDNIQVGEFGEVIICDWGLAKIISTPDDVPTDYMESAQHPDLVNSITLNGMVRGTPGYMAPEQVSCAGEKNYTTDIYGLGAILYCMLTGHPPLEGEVKEVLDKTRKGTIPPPSAIDPHIPGSLAAVAMKALHVNAEQRYQCVEELIADIQKFTHGFATAAEHAGPLKIISLLYKRHRLFFISAAAVLIGFTLLSIVYLLHLASSRDLALQERNRAQTALEKHIQEQRVSAALRHDIGRSAISAADLFWKEPLQNPSLTRQLFVDVVDELDRALTLNPTDELLWQEKGFLCFLMQRFNESARCFERGGEAYEGIRPLSRRYAGIKTDDNKIMNSVQFAGFAGELLELEEGRGTTLELLLLYDFAARGSFRNHTDNVLAVLRLLNPDWQDPVFRIKRRQALLEIGGNGLETLRITGRHSSNETLLRTLRIKHLAFLDTDFSDLDQLRFLPIASLDISRTDVHSLKSLTTMKSLIKLTLREGQFTPEELKTVPFGIRLVTVPEPEDPAAD